MGMPKVKRECLKCKTYDPKQRGSYKCACRGTCPGLWMREHKPELYKDEKVRVKQYFTIATKVHQTYGMGDSGEELMIQNKEIYARYFESTQTVAFNQLKNIEFMDDLDAKFATWEENENMGRGKKS